MFGLFKKKVSPTDFACGVFVQAKDFIATDANRSLAMRFEGGMNTQGRFEAFLLEQVGMSMDALKLHMRHFTHCSLQAAFSMEGYPTQEMTQSAMGLFTHQHIEGYDFATSYSILAAIYQGQHKFSPAFEGLIRPSEKLIYAPKTNAGVLNGGYLFESFILSNMSDTSVFLEDFQSYSGTVGASVGTVVRSMVSLSNSVKVVD